MIFPPQDQRVRAVEIRPPAIAKAGGITAGLTTIDAFERRYGKGFAHVGGHPNGARTWYDPKYHVLIDADGFDYSDDGEIFDGMSVEWMDAKSVSKEIPRIHLRKSDLGLLTRLRKGMSKRQVERAMSVPAGQWPIERTGLIRYSSNPGNRDNDRYRHWRLTFLFGPKGLEEFEVFAD